ncbi:MAG TPA: TetR/AcrR family transcriptional regulator [Solirubrobacteraceae bacterium]|nr:TetR/AcrR family transcriptional regulator [Solirubrobacteraceae bacterium]
MPLYKRLPHGPHRLARNEVIRNQRTRIHGAMVEAVAENGYEGTSVKQVIGLAGVSRRSFYEQFANKEECFLATFDLLADRGLQRVSRAYLEARGGLEGRLRAALGEFAETAASEHKAAVLVIVESQMAGAAGLLRLRRATTRCEQLLSRGFVESQHTSPLPTPIVRGIAGGLHGALSARLRDGGSSEVDDFAEEMLRWTLLFQTPAAERMAEQAAARLSRHVRDVSIANGYDPVDAEPPSEDARERLLHNVLRLSVIDDYRELTAPQIAEEAGVSINAFFELFDGKNECFLAALDMLGDELLAIAADPGLVSSDWPQAVRRVIGELMRYLADHPLYAQTIAQQAFVAGADAVQRNLELAHGIATLLTEGAPEEARCGLALEGVAGAIWHTVRCQVTGGRIQLLPALSDYLAYVVLAPFIGADAAVEAVTEDCVV